MPSPLMLYQLPPLPLHFQALTHSRLSLHCPKLPLKQRR
jgi:hypothetical protein